MPLWTYIICGLFIVLYFKVTENNISENFVPKLNKYQHFAIFVSGIFK